MALNASLCAREADASRADSGTCAMRVGREQNPIRNAEGERNVVEEPGISCGKKREQRSSRSVV